MPHTTEIKCPLCGSERFSTLMNTRTDLLMLPPSAMLPGQSSHKYLVATARACMDCGFIAIFASPDELKRKFGSAAMRPVDPQAAKKAEEAQDILVGNATDTVSDEGQLLERLASQIKPTDTIDRLKSTDTISEEALYKLRGVRESKEKPPGWWEKPEEPDPAKKPDDTNDTYEPPPLPPG
ncbi:MAG: hypothetical protein HZA50_01205 [Planctomycetes bacterium]|nr:hypothetical protein [Planctomycetota bacterium]